jgi:glyoxylase-like metal-dependent hydrolase (beta-lactamase superfamily II)
MKIVNYPYKQVEADTWDKIFQNPSDITTLSFQTGKVKINLKGTLNPDHPLWEEDEDGELEVPILVYCVHHQAEGDILLDTGLDTSYITDKYGGLEGPAVDEFSLEENENIAYHIKKHNIKLKKVFLSHLHADHAAGIRELPKDIPYILAQGEYNEYQPIIHGDFLEGLEELYEIDFTNAQNIPPLGQSVDLLGDGSLWAIKTPGHTPNHISFLINSINGPILLTMDAAFIHENLRRGIAPSEYTWDVDKAQKTLERIIDFLNMYPQVRVGAGHEALK